MARKDNRASHSKTNSNNAPITPRPSHDNHASRNDSSPPRTPPSQIDRVPRNKKGGGNAAGGAKAARNRPSLREAFGDQATDSPDRYHDPHERSSHDLSWSPRDTRDSVVDNMLLSLDQFSAGPLTSHSTTTTQTYSTESAFVQGQPFTISSSGRPRGHTVSSSMSSSYSIPFESPQTVQTRGHRSNSSTNFQTSLGRIDSVRLATDDKARIANAGQESGSGTVKAGGGAHARKSSKNSGSSSMDFGQMGGPRWQRAAARRSSSFDHGYNRPLITATTTAPVLTTYGNTHDDFDYDSLEAAPTPTVPVGPRRNHSPPPSTFRPASSVSASQTIPIRRRGSIRSPMSFLRSDQSESRKAPRGHGRTNSRDQKINSVISPHTPDKAPAPSNQVHASAAPKEKERPGFFKRVFGSSRTNAIPSPIDSRHSKGTNGSSENSTRSGSKVDGVNTTPSTKPARSMVGSPPATGNKPQAKEHPHPPLNKKSSFFRRRRKNSVSEQPAPEVPQIQALWRDVPPLNPPPSADGNIDSPSSLRKVMHPYLDSPTRIDSGTYAEPEQPKDTTSRSGNYNQSTIRAVRPVDDSDIIELPSLRDTTNTYRTNQGETTHNRTESAQEPNSKPQQVSAPHKDKSRPKSDENEPPTTHKSHLRTQSDIDKELPRLPTLNQRPIEARETSGLAQKLQTPPVRTSSREHSNSIDSAIAQKYAQKGGDDSDPRPRLRLNPSDAKSANAAVRLSPTADKSEDPRTSGSTLSDYKSANSKVQSPISPHGESLDIMPSEADLKAGLPEILESPVANLTLEEDAMSVEDKEAARRLFHGEGDIGRGDIASWLGEAGPERATIRKAYMEHFDWQSMSILAALRGFCAHLKLKGETQQVDRLLDAISTRWCNCNPNHGFKATDVVHTICYSILLLNTDLHIADIDQKMTRTQFIKNTMPTIRRVVADAAPGAFDMARGSMLPPPRAKTDGPEPLSPSFKTNTLPVTAREDYDGRRPLNRLSARPSDWSGSDNISLHDAPPDECGPLVKTPFNGKMNSWEALVEVVLRDFYNSIRQERLPLQGMEEPNPAPENCGNSITGVAGGMLRRTNSLLSRTGSETVPVRGRGMAGDGRLGNRWASKNRSRPRMYPASLAHSRTSFDDDMSVNSPSASSMWSKYSFGKTQTSMSVHSFSSDFPQGDYQQSIGFANALSQAIIREEATSDGEHETMRVGPLLEDESLELHGAPWAKEGTLKHKHHLEAVDKRAKDRAWIECFAVIEKGWMRLFQFNQKSMRSKNRMQKSGGVVGGGNWFENAQPLGQYMLRHSIASALPPPGYSKARPHVWALSLPTGAVHLFQAGTPEIVKEYVSSANYWSARLSKEPLVGAVSNIEYGWSENIINLALVADRDNGNPTQNRPPSAMHHARPSLQNSIRSSLDQGNSRPRLPGDRVIISDWTPPTQSMMASQLLEVDQLRALSTYVKNVEEELKKHNEFRSAMLLAFTPRLPNYNKAMVNWERKSSYLLREIVKFTTYIDCLQTANIAKNTIYTEQAEREKMKEELQRERIEQEQGTSGDKGIEATRSGPAPVAAT